MRHNSVILYQISMFSLDFRQNTTTPPTRTGKPPALKNLSLSSINITQNRRKSNGRGKFHQKRTPAGAFFLVGPAGFGPAGCGSQSPVPYRLAKPQYLLTRKVCKITFEKLKDGTRGSPSRRVRRRASPHEGNNKMKDFFVFRESM